MNACGVREGLSGALSQHILVYLCVKYIQTAYYIHFVVNSYWSELDIYIYSVDLREIAVAEFWILCTYWSKQYSCADTLNIWIQTLYVSGC